MGTTFLVQIANCSPSQCNDELTDQISTRLRRLHNQYSHYSPDSEVSLFNQHADDNWFPASHELVEIVELARDISERSNGAFDITVGRAVNAWGFGPGDPQLPPRETTTQQAKQYAGYAKLRSRRSPAGLRKLDPKISIDLSAIAKGYAADQLAYMLEFGGMNNYVIDIGGELRIAGVRADGKPWRVGIDSPEKAVAIDFILTPGDNAVATSGDYRNFYMLDDKRISHTIDPSTAAPVTHPLSSVTVIDPLAAHADAWATALMVMGPQSGFEFAEQAGIPALFLSRSATGLDTQVTKAMDAYLIDP